jgi:hypothetical protein
MTLRGNAMENSHMIRKNTILGLIVLPLALTAIILNTGCNSSSGDTTTVVTRAEYNQIQIGMTYDQVVAIIGSDGIEVAHASNMVAYRWENPDATIVEVSFVNGKVNSKTISDNLL